MKEAFTQTDEDAVLNGPDSASSAPNIALFALESHGVLDTGATADMCSLGVGIRMDHYLRSLGHPRF